MAKEGREGGGKRGREEVSKEGRKKREKEKRKGEKERAGGRGREGKRAEKVQEKRR